MPAIAATTPKPATKRPRRPKAEHLGMAYPDLPSTSHPLFWLAAYLRDAAEEVALEHLVYTVHSKADQITKMVLAGSQGCARDSTEKTAAYPRDAGLLLYAWPGTTAFDTTRQ